VELENSEMGNGGENDEDSKMAQFKRIKSKLGGGQTKGSLIPARG